MNIEHEINESIKSSMKSKDTIRLESLRAIKSAILLEKTKTGSKDQVDEDIILKLLPSFWTEKRLFPSLK